MGPAVQLMAWHIHAMRARRERNEAGNKLNTNLSFNLNVFFSVWRLNPGPVHAIWHYIASPEIIHFQRIDATLWKHCRTYLFCLVKTKIRFHSTFSLLKMHTELQVSQDRY